MVGIVYQLGSVSSFQAPYAKETAVLEELFDKAVDAVSYGRMIQFCATRSRPTYRRQTVGLTVPQSSLDGTTLDHAYFTALPIRLAA